MTKELDEVGSVTDEELIARLRGLVRADQTLSARLLVHIGEVDARGLYREHAYASMFAYCVEELRMSESQAYLRIQAARLGREYPRIVQLVGQGALHLSAIKLLGPHLTVDNHVQLLERASGKSKREIELLVAAIAPKPDVPSRIRKLPVRESRVETAIAPLLVDSKQAAPACADDAPFVLEPQRHRASSKPLSPGRYKMEFTAGQALHDKLAQLKDLLRHQVPDGDLATIIERAVDGLIEATMKQRFAQTKAPKKPRAVNRHARSRKANSRYIPRAVVRAVHQRDAGQCTFVSSDGKRCSECGFLELHHHDVPYARGGAATLENLRLVCRAHNALFAERDYGRTFMRSKQGRALAPIHAAPSVSDDQQAPTSVLPIDPFRLAPEPPECAQL
jgi:hypothetical protein